MMSPGWHSNILQMASKVENRMALAFPVLRMDKLAGVRSSFLANSLERIFRLANTTSKLMTIPILNREVVFLLHFNGHGKYFSQCNKKQADSEREHERPKTFSSKSHSHLVAYKHFVNI